MQFVSACNIFVRKSWTKLKDYKLNNKVLWSYHTTSHFTIKKTTFKMVYNANVLLLVEIYTFAWHRKYFAKEENETRPKCVVDLLDEVGESVNIHEFVVKQRAVRRYDSKVDPTNMNECDLMLKHVMTPT